MDEKFVPKDKHYRVGVDIGGTHVQVIIIDERTNEIVADCSEYYDGTTDININDKKYNKEQKEEIVLECVKSLIEKGINNVSGRKDLSPETIDFIGMSIPGPCEDGKILKLTNIGGEPWETIIPGLQNHLGSEYSNDRIQIANDGVCATLGEIVPAIKDIQGNILKGAFENIKGEAVYLGFGTGLSSCRVSKDGFTPMEVGHRVLERGSEEICGCGGKGHAECFCSMKRFIDKVSKELGHPEGKTISKQDLEKHIKERDSVVYPLFLDFLKRGVAPVIANERASGNPLICISGGLAYDLDDETLQIVRETAQEWSPIYPDGTLQLVVSQRRGLAQVVGAAYLDKADEIVRSRARDSLDIEKPQ